MHAWLHAHIYTRGAYLLLPHKALHSSSIIKYTQSLWIQADCIGDRYRGPKTDASTPIQGSSSMWVTITKTMKAICTYVQARVHYRELFPVARWLLCFLCTHKCAKPPSKVWGLLYPAGSWWLIKCWRLYLDVSVGSWWLIKCWRLYLDISVGSWWLIKCWRLRISRYKHW